MPPFFVGFFFFFIATFLAATMTMCWCIGAHFVFLLRAVLLHLLLLICKQGKPAEIRQAAGLLLKNNLRTAYNSLAPLNQQYVKSELLPCLGAADRGIRLTVGTVISVIVQQGHIFSWPELLQGLVQCLDSNDLNHMEGAMDALSKVGTALSESLACSLSLFHVTFWNDVDFFFCLSMNCLFKIGDASLIGFTLHGNFFIWFLIKHLILSELHLFISYICKQKIHVS